jgi:stage II sporulation protein M
MKKARKSNKRDNFKAQFRDALKYLKESKNYFIAIVLIFFGGALLGFIFSGQLGFLDEILKQLIEKVKDLNTFELILFILQNNITSAFCGLIFGVVLGIFPVLTSFANGIVLGYVLKIVWFDSGVGEFWKILPHGVFELPAVFISLALGAKLGMFIFSREKGKEFMRRARNSIILFVCIVIPLLIVAAIIEGLLISAYR